MKHILVERSYLGKFNFGPAIAVKDFLNPNFQSWILSLYSLCVGGFLREDAEHEVRFFLRLERGGDDDVLSRRQTETWADLPQVDEELWSSARRVREEEISLQVYSWLTLVLPDTDTRCTVPRKSLAFLRFCTFATQNGLSSYFEQILISVYRTLF